MRRRLVLALILVCVAAMAFFLLRLAVWPNQISIQNASGSELRDVHVELRDFQGHLFAGRLIPVLVSGDSIRLRHDHNDFKVTLKYTQNAELFVHESEIDLWTGEHYVLAVQRDGSIKGAFDYPKGK